MIFVPTSEFLKRFRFQFPSYFRSFFSLPVLASGLRQRKYCKDGHQLPNLFVCHIVTNYFFSAEQGSSRILQITPSNSPAKVYTSLCVATPQVSKRAETKGTPDTPSLQIDEGIAVERSDLCATSKHSGGDPKLDPNHEDEPSIQNPSGPTGTTTPLKGMGDSSGRMHYDTHAGTN